ncbi:hypothetical protein TNCV_2076701 [Trichonephila clavipes]|nr:hypothetical protein TNCV_2076701 [Trichonephila clavipes]
MASEKRKEITLPETKTSGKPSKRNTNQNRKSTAITCFRFPKHEFEAILKKENEKEIGSFRGILKMDSYAKFKVVYSLSF